MAKPRIVWLLGRWAIIDEFGIGYGPFGKDSLHDWLTLLSARGNIHG